MWIFLWNDINPAAPANKPNLNAPNPYAPDQPSEKYNSDINHRLRNHQQDKIGHIVRRILTREASGLRCFSTALKMWPTTDDVPNLKFSFATNAIILSHLGERKEVRG
jgi:hypothetical protein